MIEESGPVETPQSGYSKVEAASEGEFAFIHDAAEVRYETTLLDQLTT